MDWEISSQADAKAPEGSTTRESILKPEIARMYSEGKTCREIEAEIGVSHRTIVRWLNKWGIKKRKPGQKLVHVMIDNHQWLFGEYVEKRKSAETIAKELCLSPLTVRENLRKHGIKVRSGNEGTDFTEIGKKHSEWLKGRFVGDKNPNWRGGNVNPNVRLRASYDAKQWSSKVRGRDGHKCQECGATGRLHAHHVKPWKNNPSLRFDVENGITLCPVCHQRAHGFKFPKWVMEESPRVQDT